MKTWLVTGGAGFIGANFILQQRSNNAALIVNLDKLTYAGNLYNLASLKMTPTTSLSKATSAIDPW